MKKLNYLYIVILISFISVNKTISQTNDQKYSSINPSSLIQKSNKISTGKTSVEQPKIVLNPTPVVIYSNGFQDSYGNVYMKIGGKYYKTPDPRDLSTCIEAYGSAGFTNYILKADPVSLGEPSGIPPSTTMNLRIGAHISVKKGKTYSVRFKAAADSARTIDVLCTQKFAPFDTALWIREIPLDTTLTTYGSYLLNWGQNLPQKTSKTQKSNITNSMFVSEDLTSDSMAFEFAIGASLIPVYLDDIEIVEVYAPEINIVQGDSIIFNETGIFNFGDVELGSSESVLFTLENTGNTALNLSEGLPKVSVQSDGAFSLKTDAVSPVFKENSTTFEIMFEPALLGETTGIISIANDDASENPYNFMVKGNGVNINSAIEIEDYKSGIKVFPNPTSNEINISFANVPEACFIKLYNNQGQLLIDKRCSKQNEKLNIINFSKGIYFLNIISEEFIQSEKIIVE